MVNKYKYLGVIISNDNKILLDIKKCCSSFLRQFYSFYRKFKSLDIEILIFLYKSFCMSFYGAELWYCTKGSMVEFQNLEIAYHKTIKRILGFPNWESNHTVCQISGLPIFRHYVNTTIVSFMFHIANSTSPCILPIKPYILYKSFFAECVNLIFYDQYQINNILSNDLDAIKSRIDFVQRNESIQVIE